MGTSSSTTTTTTTRKKTLKSKKDSSSLSSSSTLVLYSSILIILLSILITNINYDKINNNIKEILFKESYKQEQEQKQKKEIKSDILSSSSSIEEVINKTKKTQTIKEMNTTKVKNENEKNKEQVIIKRRSNNKLKFPILDDLFPNYIFDNAY